jgi:hypothetical protein
VIAMNDNNIRCPPRTNSLLFIAYSTSKAFRVSTRWRFVVPAIGLGRETRNIPDHGASALSTLSRWLQLPSPVDELAQIPLSYPTYAGTLVRAAVSAAHQLDLKLGWQAHQAG